MFKKYEPVCRKDYDAWKRLQDEPKQKAAADPRRLHYHLMPDIGWLNDPNGLCQFHGLYHLYYQYDPFDANGDLKLWAHVTTRDFIRYEEQEPFLFPDSDLDTHGVYSGSAFVEDGRIHYFYTGNIKLFDREDYDYIHSGRVANTIHLESTDGWHFAQKELVMGMDDYPKDLTQHIRDPKLCKENGIYYMVQGSRDLHDHGCVQMFRSSDLHHWQPHIRIQSDEPLGYMWECPDLFFLNGQKILITCPQGVPAQGDDYANVHSVTWMTLSGSLEEGLHIDHIHQLDRGFDFYAPQTFEDEQGRRILIGWMGIPDADYTNPTVDHGWQHALTLPRELTFIDGQLRQQPLKELEALRFNTRVFTEETMNAAQIDEECYELDMRFQECHSLHLQLSEEMHIIFKDGTFTLDIQKAGSGRISRSLRLNTLKDLRIFSDTSSLELFLNGGSEVFTTRVYPNARRCVKLIQAEGCRDITLHFLRAYQIS